LNELINTEPKYDPTKPGLRTHGDAVSTNHGGELKLYFGVDRINTWGGGTVAYATSVKSIPAVLSVARKHGLENYAHFSSVNSAESTQILSKAKDILKYMAYGAESLTTFPEQITDDIAVYYSKKPDGDLRGLPSNICYTTDIIRPISPLYELLKDSKTEYSDEELIASINYLFEALTFRPAKPEETQSYLDLVKETVSKLGPEEGVLMGLTAIFLDRDALFRTELVENSKPDTSGRSMLQDWELGLALNHSLSYIKPDSELRSAIVEGRMRTKEDVRREVTRMLEDESIRKPRVLQFFREYFDYDLAGYICKDAKVVELILAEDKDVLKELLTTQKVVASRMDSILFGKQNSQEEQDNSVASAELKKAIEENRVERKRLTDITEHYDDIKKQMNARGITKERRHELYREFAVQKNKLRELHIKVGGAAVRHIPRVTQADFVGPEIHTRVGYLSFGKGSLFPGRTLGVAPEGQRLGILTHPSWLVSHSDAMDNHAIHRGIWIRKKLLGGGIPDVPITVDAQLPDEPKSTLRERMRVTQEKYCWSCHEKMDPLGLPFEMYNHVGLYREEEKGKPIDTSGEIIDSGDPILDGKVTDAIDMIRKLANSERVEQVFVRHAFRYWIGRNETLHDGPTLKAAHKAYRDNGGSMKALITSLVTSDAFLYRK